MSPLAAEPRVTSRPPLPAPAPGPGEALPSSPPATGDSEAAGALRLYAAILDAGSARAAAHRLVAVLAREFGAVRCTLGRHERGQIRLLACSALELADGRSPDLLTQRLAGAMAEAIDQGTALAWPASSALSHDVIRHEQAQLHRHAGTQVLTFPIGLDGDVFGAVCLETPIGAAALAPAAGPGTDPAILVAARLQRWLALAVPALRWMARAEEPLHRRAAGACREAAHRLRHPGRRPLRLALAGVLGLAAFVAAVPVDRTVSGRARIEGAEQRVIAAPIDGFVRQAHVRPGDRVLAGQALVDLVDDDQRLERDRLASQLAQNENAYAAAMGRADRVAASTGLARIGETQAQLALVDEQLSRGRLAAPFDALVIQGDLAQSAGAPVRQGDTLMILATTGRERVVVEIDEIDIAAVVAGQAGSLAVSSLPWERRALVVERVAPLAHAVEGRNVFEVEARLEGAGAALRPGLLGRADLVVGRSPLLWSGLRHAVERLRLAWWAWVA